MIDGWLMMLSPEDILEILSKKEQKKTSEVCSHQHLYRITDSRLDVRGKHIGKMSPTIQHV